MGKYRLRITGDLGFEVWQDIPGYEGYYQISTYGNVRSVERRIWGGKAYYKVPSRNKTLSKNNWDYYVVRLSKDGADRDFLVHRLVADTFIPNPQNCPQINHKDEDKTNNRVENLEWCTQQYNNCYGTRNARVSEKMKTKGPWNKGITGYHKKIHS